MRGKVKTMQWRGCNEEHMIDGAPALTTDSLCNCALGEVISIVDNLVSMGGVNVQGAKSGYIHNNKDVSSDSKDSTEIIKTTQLLRTTSVLGVTTIGNVSEEYKEIISNRYKKAHYASLGTVSHERGVYYNANST